MKNKNSDKEFDKWWLRFEPQIAPSTYNYNEKEVMKAVGRCAWEAALVAVLQFVEKIKKERPKTKED